MFENFNYAGVMLDNSRNAVMNIPTVKKMIDILNKLECNTLMLYTEDTYELNNQPYFGYFRGRYSKAELKELDAYAKERGIELVPCIQTLGHLNAIMRWPQYAEIRDCNDILCAGEDKVYELIEDMFATIAECFTSRLVNVGMDEAEMMGLGKYLKKHGYRKRIDILQEHLNKVAEIAEKYGFTILMWSDMFYKLATGTYYGESVEMSDEQLKQMEQVSSMIPKNVRLIYWDYWKWEQRHYDRHIECHKRLAEDIWFAGALWSWVGFAPHNAFTVSAMTPAIKSCKMHNVQNVIFTAWGDDGGETARFSLLPALYHNICLMKGIESEVEIKRSFETIFDIAYDDFILLDLPGTTNDNLNNNADKYLLYNDPFMGILDMAIPEDEGLRFGNCAKKLKPLIAHEKWGYLFESACALCEVLELKANLGQRTRIAYQKEDKEAIDKLIPVYHECIERMRVFYQAYERQWMIENKPHGFEVQDIRLGGLIQRLEHCADRLQKYVDGDVVKIEELEERLLNPFGKADIPVPNDFCCNLWKDLVTVNII